MNTHLYLTKKVPEDILESRNFKQFYKNFLKVRDDKWKDCEWYSKRFDLHYSSLPENTIGRTFEMESLSPVLIGSGTDTVLESYLTFHKIYGVPYIPGTTIKGIVAHYCHNIVGKENSDFQQEGKYFRILFGGHKEKGFITFHDALCEPNAVRNSLALDIMTPHHQEYKSGPNLSAPRDDDTPVPIFFLVVNGKFKFLITCEGKQEEHQEWVDLAKNLVICALKTWGIGGKTNAGYGRFALSEEKGSISGRRKC